MKGLKLKSRELEKIGFDDPEIISLIINLVKKQYKKGEKEEVLSLLKKFKEEPNNFTNHPVLGKVIKKINEKKTSKDKDLKVAEPRTYKLTDIPKEYVIYGKENIEEEALKQMETAMRLPITIRGALMPDAHSGYGLPIGGVVATENSIIPFGVGMDIGCRVCLSIFPLKPEVLDEKRNFFKKVLIENTRFGQKDYFHEKKEHPVLDRKEFQEIKFLKSLKDKAYEQLGTSGGGNHFVEFGIVELPDNNDFKIPGGEYVGLLSHSGSRNFGACIAQHYTQIAKSKCNLPKGAINLAWLDLDTEEGQEYWQAMNLAGDYAKANHEIIHKKISTAIGEKPILVIENHHNFAWKEKIDDKQIAIVHRKGATPAFKGVYGVIPGSMTLPGFIVKGKGNILSLNSASHGAGRLMSREQAKKTFTRKELLQVLEKAGVELIGGGLDEAPMAYKDINEVMEYQKDLVDIVGTFYPKIVRME